MNAIRAFTFHPPPESAKWQLNLINTSQQLSELPFLLISDLQSIKSPFQNGSQHLKSALWSPITASPDASCLLQTSTIRLSLLRRIPLNPFIQSLQLFAKTQWQSNFFHRINMNLLFFFMLLFILSSKKRRR